ncbi:hypothetical protein K458DRAFT_401738 [Lentithecium fluviatile CBS 122367]|uniref:Uncharacterized protein n=1 Tax=Lentithecium fluviatile CBS 122367 TaxID=1168545 RepID=A0A6G1J9R0_9PLEO|nr:hypothetical protein K458DRAFT_401738 [Lentithecium fluviatile CBS 122367]
MEYPDFPCEMRTGAACYSTPQNGIVVYLDTRTSVARTRTSDKASSFTTTVPSSSSMTAVSTLNPPNPISSQLQDHEDGLGRSDRIALGVGVPSAVVAVLTVGYGIWRCCGRGRERSQVESAHQLRPTTRTQDRSAIFNLEDDLSAKLLLLD